MDTKSNEITAIPKLLRSLDIEVHTIRLDAMGCQKAVAQEAYFAKADYILALKANHETLYNNVEALFKDSRFTQQQQQSEGKTFSLNESVQRGHGRGEKRTLLVTDALGWIDEKERKHWLGLQSIVCVEAHRKNLSKEHTSVQRMYYLTSHKPDAKVLQKLIQQHWSIENQCHWILDEVWDEDGSRIRKGNAPENVALLRKLAINLLKHDTTVKDSIRGKRLQATFDEKVLEEFLKINPSK